MAETTLADELRAADANGRGGATRLPSKHAAWKKQNEIGRRARADKEARLKQESDRLDIALFGEGGLPQFHRKLTEGDTSGAGGGVMGELLARREEDDKQGTEALDKSRKLSSLTHEVELLRLKLKRLTSSNINLESQKAALEQEMEEDYAQLRQCHADRDELDERLDEEQRALRRLLEDIRGQTPFFRDQNPTVKNLHATNAVREKKFKDKISKLAKQRTHLVGKIRDAKDPLENAQRAAAKYKADLATSRRAAAEYKDTLHQAKTKISNLAKQRTHLVGKIRDAKDPLENAQRDAAKHKADLATAKRQVARYKADLDDAYVPDDAKPYMAGY